MKKISRKLVASSLSLAFATVALGTTTFAWFTTNATVDADIKVNVQQSGDSILISKDCIGWGNSVSFDYTETVANGGDGTFEMTAVTYNAGDSTLDVNDTLTDMDGNATTANSQYLKFTVFLKVSNSGKKVTFNNVGAEATNVTDGGLPTYTLLNETTFFNYGTGVAGAKVDTPITMTKGTKVKVDAINALRGVLDVTPAASAGEYDTDIADGATFGQALNATFGASTVADLTFERKDTIVAYASEDAQASSFNGVTTTNFGQSLAKDNAANSYINAVLGTEFVDTAARNIANKKYAAEPNYAGHALSAGWYGTYDDNNVLFTTTDTNQVYALTFTYWLEGYDADCFDVVFAQTMSFALGFKTAE